MTTVRNPGSARPSRSRLLLLLLIGVTIAAMAGPLSGAVAATLPTPTVSATGQTPAYVGYPVLITAAVSNPAAPGETVTLQKYSGLVWKPVYTATLDGSSQATFTVVPTSTAGVRYRVQIAATATHRAGTSAPVTISPVLKTPVITLTGPASVVVHKQATLTASVTDPTAVGETVTLQQSSGLSWSPVADRALDSNSQATFTVTPAATGSTTYRVTIAKTTLHAAATSGEHVLTTIDACGGVVPPKFGGGAYSCSFGDDFDGTTLDTTNWLVAETASSGQPLTKNYCFVNDPDNVSVSGGQLHLSARVESAPFTCGSPLGPFTTQVTSGAITTKGNFKQAYGYFEFRARFPDVNVAGAHSGLWMNPDKLTYGPWPRSGEIDVAERYSALPDHVYPSVHYEDGAKNVVSGDCIVPSAGTAFHTYAVEWLTTGTMRFYYDGALCFQHTPTPLAPLTAPQPFDQDFNVVLEQIFGGGWNAPTDQTPGVVTMDVDRVRVWH